MKNKQKLMKISPKRLDKLFRTALAEKQLVGTGDDDEDSEDSSTDEDSTVSSSEDDDSDDDSSDDDYSEEDEDDSDDESASSAEKGFGKELDHCDVAFNPMATGVMNRPPDFVPVAAESKGGMYST